MTYYHQSKEEALDAGIKYESHWHVSTELVESNGWVMVLRPMTLEVLKYPLFDLLAVAEIRFDKTCRILPPEHRRPPRVDVDKPKRERRSRRSRRGEAVAAPPPPPPPPPPPS